MACHAMPLQTYHIKGLDLKIYQVHFQFSKDDIVS